MNFITREQARRDIVALGLPQIVLDAFDGKPLPYNLDIYFREPYTVFALDPKCQAAYGKGRITPIWTGEGDHTIVAYHHAPERKGFFRFDIEPPAEEEGPVGLNWQQVLVKEFKSLWEPEWPDEQLREVAGWFGFKYIDLLIAELSQAKLDTFEEDAVLVPVIPGRSRGHTVRWTRPGRHSPHSVTSRSLHPAPQVNAVDRGAEALPCPQNTPARWNGSPLVVGKSPRATGTTCASTA